ncbi:MAG: TonB family protein [Kofleriaceae bacterium]|nr:TonB family protein [Kofleriaceae bacterium]
MPSQRLFLAGLLFTGCATTGLPSNLDRTEHARVELAPLRANDTVELVPRAIEPGLPSADRISRTIYAELGDVASVEVHYCVSPAGKLTDAELVRGSSLPAFDDAVMTDLRSWHFDVQPGPESLQTCDRATIVYRPRS